MVVYGYLFVFDLEDNGRGFLIFFFSWVERGYFICGFYDFRNRLGLVWVIFFIIFRLFWVIVLILSVYSYDRKNYLDKCYKMKIMILILFKIFYFLIICLVVRFGLLEI